MPIKYPKRQCKNPSCSQREFVPKRSDQLFCDQECKNYYHNQEKKKKKETVFNKEKILKHNYESLKKLYTYSDYKQLVPEIILKHEKINLTVFTDQGVNEATNRKILWSHGFGLELASHPSSGYYIIHRR
jgi:hypothetical protein